MDNYFGIFHTVKDLWLSPHEFSDRLTMGCGFRHHELWHVVNKAVNLATVEVNEIDYLIIVPLHDEPDFRRAYYFLEKD